MLCVQPSLATVSLGKIQRYILFLDLLSVLYLSVVSMGWVRHIWACPFRWISGIPCPACGTTRAILLLLQGEVSASLRMNPYGLLTLFAILFLNVWFFYDLLKRKNTLDPTFHRLELVFKKHWWVVIPLVIIAFSLWGWRLYHGIAF